MPIIQITQYAIDFWSVDSDYDVRMGISLRENPPALTRPQRHGANYSIRRKFILAPSVSNDRFTLHYSDFYDIPDEWLDIFVSLLDSQQ